jgi:hypothetical protein
MKRSLSTYLLTALGLLLLVYSAVRSWDFISMTLPAGQQILAAFALFGIEGGLMFWLLFFLHGAAGAAQRAVALVMMVVDFLASGAMFTADTLFRSGQAGLVTELDQQAMFGIIVGLSLVLLVNIGAVILSHVLDPAATKAAAVQEGQAEIDNLVIEQIRQVAPRVAAELAPEIAADWAARTAATYRGSLARLAAHPATKAAHPLPAAIAEEPAKAELIHTNGNGKVK